MYKPAQVTRLLAAVFSAVALWVSLGCASGVRSEKSRTVHLAPEQEAVIYRQMVSRHADCELDRMPLRGVLSCPKRGGSILVGWLSASSLSGKAIIATIGSDGRIRQSCPFGPIQGVEHVRLRGIGDCLAVKEVEAAGTGLRSCRVSIMDPMALDRPLWSSIVFYWCEGLPGRNDEILTRRTVLYADCDNDGRDEIIEVGLEDRPMTADRDSHDVHGVSLRVFSFDASKHVFVHALDMPIGLINPEG